MTHTGNLLGIEATGRRVSTAGATFFRIRDGVILEDWDVWDLLGIMRQLQAPVATNA
jgi:predicted ester cyclase